MTEPRHNPECIGLVLAAGTGQRFGSDKRCAKLADGNSLLRVTVLRTQEAFSDVRVVLKAEDDAQALLANACKTALTDRLIPCLTRLERFIYSRSL
ncbi:NTP transferase domain-containing protein [Stutzerimonas nitrititolerans]|uniref:NTP transferase domain-containing protein n=1 Tax=Stutzerimonas nitrititolerans TaxID=2482751 RepID=UPI0028AA50CC|nr:NTP transferase domain-containing protein [Stutzerimonas nitrititolerans]